MSAEATPIAANIPAPSPVPTGEDTAARAPKPVPSKHRKRKGLKPRHIPQRTCIVTRQTGDKRGLIRVVRTPEGRVEVDPTGKKNGRGAYLTADRAIWEKALAGNILARALKVEIAPEDAMTLRMYAETLERNEE